MVFFWDGGMGGGDIALLLGILVAVLDNDQSPHILKRIISKGEKGRLVVKTVRLELRHGKACKHRLWSSSAEVSNICKYEVRSQLK